MYILVVVVVVYSICTYLKAHGKVFVAVGHGIAAHISPAPEAVAIGIAVGHVQGLLLRATRVNKIYVP